ncbi:MAG: DEAD/DEAH box helicase family protein [Cyanobacteria bacterium]|nr:DEAD/DEAH box helicase family protein [Cyanobacteria bacterium CG_2015-16_32_12]NCO78834.1 DEAD/DEAH box helicase family protein [Cyanobacteria bacterium CG_2015-22_32_23]NCQ04635.1 DEAD/DEAH box helicase family protein [Cyanobacteria bacterium CG_2015-09_32_10]NCQ42778.1 DEAD/DEAH box helicase family protein [Cyanobacteria bacterium CG_2015-04_32_10]NCS83320.1 DEAD/DEAH box helicase family protein [Cyanobacteria bacterium CG_2015-02_32_10]
MTLLLVEKDWLISYSSNENNPIADFYIPALECAIKYDRKSGFFNSAILSKVAQGLEVMVYNEGQMRLIMGCEFSEDDLQAISKGYELKERLNSCLNRQLLEPENLIELKHFEILSWLIANNFLEIKIAIPLQKNGLPEQLNRHKLFHEKTGIFTDKEGNKIAFSGSNNESLGGWETNVESFHVYCAWEGERDLQRVNEEQFRFDQLWDNLAPNVKVFDIPTAIKTKLLRYTPKNKPILINSEKLVNNVELTVNNKELINNEQYKERELEENNISNIEEKVNLTAEEIEAEKEKFAPLLDIHNHEGCLAYCLESIPVKPWIHQRKILLKFIADFPTSALISDEVGLGKTISTGIIVRYLLISRQVQRVLILAPKSVQSQWHEELREKFNLHFWSYSKGVFTNPDGKTITPINNIWNEVDLVLASSHLARQGSRSQELLQAKDWDLVVVDEAHHARRRNPSQREDNPNRLLALLRELKAKTKSLLLLTATPMQLDTIEVFDLLNLVGLKGLWQYQDNFCDYFDSLPLPVNDLRLNFWQSLTVDYFQQGGKPCAIFEQYLQQNNRLLLYSLKDTWEKGKLITPWRCASVNPRKVCQNQEFIDTSKQFLTINTPLKDLMFRHTRETLREYYRRGILKYPIPNRLVFDNAIILNPINEIPLYQAVSDYVRHFYNLAQQQNRFGLGFLMTLYRRRLTSSFYAIKKSLERRLEGISITDDDLMDLDDADDNIIEGLEGYFQATDPAEIEYLENILRQCEQMGEDTKLSHYLTLLRQELMNRETVITFFQYTDTMDYVRDTLVQLYGNQVACYSGRGGELYENGRWKVVKKEVIKRLFTMNNEQLIINNEGLINSKQSTINNERLPNIKILLCTKSASEGLNLQTCGVLFQYSCPWNPMQIEQQIGRLDRIGQIHPTIRIHNFYYDGTVEAKVYQKLRSRINAFETVVGNLQPILAQVPTFIEQAVMAADPEEEGVLLSELENLLDNPPIRPDLEQMTAINVSADLQLVNQKIPPNPLPPKKVEQIFTQSRWLQSQGITFQDKDDDETLLWHLEDCSLSDRIWLLKWQKSTYHVTFYPEVYEEHPSVKLMSLGEPLVEKLLSLFL